MTIRGVLCPISQPSIVQCCICFRSGGEARWGGGGWMEMGGGRLDVRFDVMNVDVGSSLSVPRGLVW